MGPLTAKRAKEIMGCETDQVEDWSNKVSKSLAWRQIRWKTGVIKSANRRLGVVWTKVERDTTDDL